MKYETLGNLVSIMGGGTPDRSNPEYWGGSIPWVTVKDFKSHRISSASESITPRGLTESASKLVPAGAILLPTRMALGKAAINTIDVAINQDLKALLIQDFTSVDRNYLFRFLLSKSKYIESCGKGATVKGITLDILRDMVIPTPPLEEQKRIAAILDKADSLRRKRQHAIRLTDEFLQALFNEMFGGRPKMRAVTDYASFLAGFAFKSERYVSTDEGGRLIRGVNIGVGNFDWSDAVAYPDSDLVGLERFRLRSGDVLLAMDRPWISSGLKCSVVGTKEDGTFLVQRVARLRPTHPEYGDFVRYCLMSDAFKSHCRVTETTVPHISPKDFSTYLVPDVSDQDLRKFAQTTATVRRMSHAADSSARLADDLAASVQDQLLGGA